MFICVFLLQKEVNVCCAKIKEVEKSSNKKLLFEISISSSHRLLQHILLHSFSFFQFRFSILPAFSLRFFYTPQHTHTHSLSPWCHFIKIKSSTRSPEDKFVYFFVCGSVSKMVQYFELYTKEKDRIVFGCTEKWFAF